MECRDPSDINGDFIVRGVVSCARTGDHARDFDAVSEEIELGAGFDASGFLRDEQISLSRSKFNQLQVTATGADRAVDDNIIDSSYEYSAAVCCAESACSPCVDTFGTRANRAACGYKDVATCGETAAKMDGLGGGQNDIRLRATSDDAASQNRVCAGAEGD